MDKKKAIATLSDYRLIRIIAKDLAGVLLVHFDPLASCCGNFAFPTFTRFFKVLIFLHVGNNTGFFAGLFEPLECSFERFVVAYEDTRHAGNHPFLWRM